MATIALSATAVSVTLHSALKGASLQTSETATRSQSSAPACVISCRLQDGETLASGSRTRRAIVAGLAAVCPVLIAHQAIGLPGASDDATREARAERDFSTAATVLGSDLESGWTQEVAEALKKVSSSEEAKAVTVVFASALGMPHAVDSVQAYGGAGGAFHGAKLYGQEASGVQQQTSLKASSLESGVATESIEQSASLEDVGIGGLHHVGLLCASTERSLEFYCGVLGLELNEDRKNAKLPYGGAWLWVGKEMVHLMELPNPDPLDGRPAHGGRDRHACFAIKSVEALRKRLDDAGISYTMSKSGRPALFTRDPDGNALEFSELPK